MNRRAAVAVAALLTLAVGTAHATWSIILVDTQTREIAVGSATCVEGIDLRYHLPVIRVGLGAACAQSFVDTSGQNRLLIWNEIARGTPPATILELLAARDAGHQTRQYGIVDILGRAVTFSGAQNGAFANGITGQVDAVVFSIQGNVITGQPVLDMARAAIMDTPGGLPEKLMAAMEAARLMGGDGRCSCAPEDPTGCGSPPPAFTKSAHVGFMLDARPGDSGGVCPNGGCANGSYYMALNVANRGAGDPDPVITLREQFDAFRASQNGLPDAIESIITITPARLPADGESIAQIRVEARDWRGMPATGTTSVTVGHILGDAGSCSIGPVINRGGGVFTCNLTAGEVAGLDRFLVRAYFGTTSRFLVRPAELRVVSRGDMDGDGLINNFDVDPYVLAIGNPAVYQQVYGLPAAVMADINQDGSVNNFDIDPFIACVNLGACP